MTLNSGFGTETACLVLQDLHALVTSLLLVPWPAATITELQLGAGFPPLSPNATVLCDMELNKAVVVSEPQWGAWPTRRTLCLL